MTYHGDPEPAWKHIDAGKAMTWIMHHDLWPSVIGGYMKKLLIEKTASLAVLSPGMTEPSVSIVIRSRNNVGDLCSLLDDVECQSYSGDVEVIVVDSESRDGSAERSQERGAIVVHIKQAEYSHSRALNAGFEAAKHEWVFSLVEHSALSHRLTLRVATRWNEVESVVGISGIAIPGKQASITEQVFGLPIVVDFLRRPAREAKRDGMGVLATNCSAFRRNAWRELGGFDERFGGGGEDGQFCRTALLANRTIVLDPAMSLFHSHRLGPINSLRQVRHWTEMGRPEEFSLERLKRYRSDLRDRFPG